MMIHEITLILFLTRVDRLSHISGTIQTSIYMMTVVIKATIGRHLPAHSKPNEPRGQGILQESPKYPNVHARKNKWFYVYHTSKKETKRNSTNIKSSKTNKNKRLASLQVDLSYM